MLLCGEEPATKLARRYGVSEQALHQWRDESLAGGEAALGAPKGQNDPRDRKIHELQKELSERAQVEVEWLKENLRSSPEEKRRWIDPEHPMLSVARQCELVGLPRSSWYYEPAGETSENLELMRAIDE
jgi:putative transposase